ncbi:acetylornithine deacetylase [Enemella evansiae]|uniref:Acetylornithine deacetylase n=1 Tax=Enemella evansiae TaxID=2016499 RepID=A0A255GTQ0_9ACTN|nr:acetylornithine deacetylase [Enemella evansiae]OYO16009.1 acetylornithine deacetylase [Enemella evansiae]OYO16474.1 acetylornithine deacetylase [Enemella evansiae]
METPRSLDWIVKLVSQDTTSRNPNQPVIDLIADEARRLGLDPKICPSPQQGKANLLVTVPAADGSTAGGVVLSGHSDVVPVDDQDWSSDPFAPDVRDGRLYGRGTCDMKGFIGVAVSALPEMVEAELTEPIHLAVSYDEEVGCIGGDQIVKDIAELGLTPRACIVGEPTSMQVIRGHKSINLGRVTFRGKAAHSSLTPEGVNAIEYAAKFVVFLRGIADQWRSEGPFDEAYPVPHSTLSTNIIHGGIAGNTVPDRCVVEFEFRGLAELDPAATMQRIEAYARELEQQMRGENEIAGVDFEVPAMVPGLETPAEAEAISLGAALGGVRSDGKVTYGTEAGQFSGAGIETVVCGPGDIAQAHTADEYVDLAQLQACEEFIHRLISHLSKETS